MCTILLSSVHSHFVYRPLPILVSLVVDFMLSRVDWSDRMLCHQVGHKINPSSRFFVHTFQYPENLMYLTAGAQPGIFKGYGSN